MKPQPWETERDQETATPAYLAPVCTSHTASILLPPINHPMIQSSWIQSTSSAFPFPTAFRLKCQGLLLGDVFVSTWCCNSNRSCGGPSFHHEMNSCFLRPEQKHTTRPIQSSNSRTRNNELFRIWPPHIVLSRCFTLLSRLARSRSCCHVHFVVLLD